MLRLVKHAYCALITILMALGPTGVLVADANDFSFDDTLSTPTALRVVDTLPQPGAGIVNSARVHDDTSVAVLIETRYGIDYLNPDSIRFLISDGEFEPYRRNLNSPAVRAVEVAADSLSATAFWAVYDRSLEPNLPRVYPLDSIVQIQLVVEDIYSNEITVEHHEFKTESDRQQADAFDHLPHSRSFDIENDHGTHDAGVEVVSGVWTGARIFYNSNEPILPAFGSIDEVEPAAFGPGQAIGVPLNLMPHTVFNRPVKLYMPFPEETDVTQLDIYYFNGVQWLPACDAGGNLLSGGNGWMVPGSRVNHQELVPPQIEVEVYHFSAAQAVVSGNSTSTGKAKHENSGSGAVIYVSCFIDTAASGSTIGLSLMSLMSLLSLLGFESWKAWRPGG